MSLILPKILLRDLEKFVECKCWRREKKTTKQTKMLAQISVIIVRVPLIKLIQKAATKIEKVLHKMTSIRSPNKVSTPFARSEILVTKVPDCVLRKKLYFLRQRC